MDNALISIKTEPNPQVCKTDYFISKVEQWAKEKGINYVHYGGGLSASENDSLYIYKSKFAKNTKFEFWVGKKVWNNNIYNKLCQKTGVSENESFFPAYRKNMQELKIPN